MAVGDAFRGSWCGSTKVFIRKEVLMEEIDAPQPGWLLILIEDPSDTDEGDGEFSQVIVVLHFVFFPSVKALGIKGIIFVIFVNAAIVSLQFTRPTFPFGNSEYTTLFSEHLRLFAELSIFKPEYL